MLAAASAQARSPRLYLQCRHKSTLSAINRTLDQSIRRDRRKTLDDLNRVKDDRGGNFPWQDRDDRSRSNEHSDRPRPSNFGDRPKSNDYSDRPRSTNFSDRPRSSNFGDRPRSSNFGDRPRSNDYNDRPRSNDYGDRPRSNDYGRNRFNDSEDRGDRRTPRNRDYAQDAGDRDQGFKRREPENHRGDVSRKNPTRTGTSRGDFAIRKTNQRPSEYPVGDLTDSPNYQVLKVPFTDKYHFTQQNWNDLMGAVKLAEDKYIRALPTRPSELPKFDKDEPGVVLKIKQQLKKTFKQDLATVEPTLTRERADWLRVIQHAGEAIKNAKANNIFIPGRRWFEESDPVSATKASVYPIQPPATPAQGANWKQELEEISVLNKEMRSAILQTLVDRNAAALISGQELRAVNLVTSLDTSISAKQAKERDLEEQRESAKEAKERRRLEEESRLDDDQLFSLVNNNREKNDDRKNKYKEIQEPRDRRDGDRDRRDGDRDSRPAPRSSRDEDMYVSVPYTTAASEFLYGFNVVVAALTAKRRQMYNVYIHKRATTDYETANSIKTLCKQARVKYTDVDDSFLPKMDKMAQGRPHNGLILEASPLPTLPTKSLGKLRTTDTAIPIELADQSAEEIQVNGNPSTIPFHYTTGWRKPFVLLLDGILDPGNLGNILRTAHFYGVDAVAICTNTCAPVNLPIVQKAASGAAEALTILSIPGPANFITTCKKHGWSIYAAVAPDANSAKSAKGNLVTSTMISPLSKNPSILCIGAEGEGLRANLATKADANVGIRGAKPALPSMNVGVDSLNVGSSVAVLLEAFFRKPDDLEDLPRGMVKETDVVGRIV
jgi:21S rRNA (GM2251-2'-O)-methyltransferase